MKTLFRALMIASLFAAGCGSAEPAGSVVGATTTTACVQDADCATGQHCLYPVKDGCAAKGSCVTPVVPTGPHCNSILLLCGCDGTKVAVACDASDVAPVPIKGGSC